MERPKITHRAYLMVHLSGTGQPYTEVQHPQVPTLPRVDAVGIFSSRSITEKVGGAWAEVLSASGDSFEEAKNQVMDSTKGAYPTLYYWLLNEDHKAPRDQRYDHHMRLYGVRPSPTF